MRILKVLSRHRADFTATLVCEHCGHEQKLDNGYDDDHYHSRVIPAITCQGCGRNRAGEIPNTPNDHGTAHVGG